MPGGVVEETTSVTVIVEGEFWAPAALTVMCPVYVPDDKPLMFTVTCNVCGAVPLAGEPVSHVLSLATVKLNVPDPVLLMFEVAAEGLLPPSVALNEIVVGETANTGCGGGGTETVRLTVTIFGEPWAPAEVTVICPV